jgi:hypothetical protein
MEEIVILFVMLCLIAVPVGMVVGVAYFAARSRKKKQDALKESLPSDVEFSAMVRYNRGAQQDKILKIKAFEGSGILYLQGKTAHFKSTTGFSHSFELSQTKVRWEGENLINGLLKWFSMQDYKEKIYFNVESGLFIFHTGAGKMTTKQIYERMTMEQID